jgi:predicted heme/steroid binding protein
MPRTAQRGSIVLTDQELSRYNGSDPSLPIYLGLDGVIYDVSASPHFYGPGASYHVFAGRDATRAFVTGCFQDDTTPDMRGVEEMYVPKDLDEPPELGPDATEEEKREARRAWKLKREHFRSEGRKRARGVIDGWIKTFNGGKGGKYFKVGTIKRDEDWKEKLGPKRRLCKRAEDQRPATSPVEA